MSLTLTVQVSELVYKVLLLGIEQASYFRERSSLSLFTRYSIA